MKQYAKSFKVFEESYYTPGLRYPKQLDLSKEEIDIVKQFKWTDLDWEQIGNDGHNIAWLNLLQPLDFDISDGVVVDIQIIKGTFYQVHISLAEQLRGIGLGTKIYQSLVRWLGHIYSGKGRRSNPIIENIFNVLRKDPKLKCVSNSLGDMCVDLKNPDADGYLATFLAVKDE